MNANLNIGHLLGLFLKKITVPSEFHDQVEAVKEMQKDDVSGLVDSLTDFAVDSACVDFTIETDNEKFSATLKRWLSEVNKGYKGRIPSGIRALAKEYFQERWKYSSFPVLKISDWEKINGIKVPTKMFFVDGASIHAKDLTEGEESLKLINYDYYLGKTEKEENKLGNNVIFARPYGRWFDKYPTPYLIKRGVYHNWKIIESLKNKETEILDQVIPYLLLIKKGSENLELKKDESYTNEQLKVVVKEFQQLIDKAKSAVGETKAPTRATNFDEEIKHFIPDLSTIFAPTLFEVAEKGILTGMGFIDIAEAVSTSRRESILNPKAFIKEITTGVEDFKQILKELVFLIKSQNESHIKYINSEFYITASPISIFHTDDFKNQMRLLWERGQLSNQTYCEIVGQVEYRTEKSRREKEAKQGDEYTMYPHLTRNDEDKGIDIVGEEPIKKKTQKDVDKNGKPIPTEKIDDKEKYDIGKKKSNLETAPYTKIKDLPPAVKKKLTPAKQRAWMKIFNNAYRFYMKKFGDVKKAESLAFRTAWSQIKQVKAKKKSKRNKKI